MCGMLRAQARDASPGRDLLIGESQPMRDLHAMIRLIGPRQSTVLITGETGTGKEMVARAIHMASQRAESEMVAVNCAAIPENLVEAELFGHAKGAFTGATNPRAGRFEQAHRGTIFLDEIGEIPLEVQPKLLRVLQEREIQRVGSSETIQIDTRVIAASNVDLHAAVEQKRFREDLLYRLNVVPMRVPPLRERISDIPLLADHFIEKVCLREGISAEDSVSERSRSPDRLRMAGQRPPAGARHRNGGHACGRARAGCTSATFSFRPPRTVDGDGTGNRVPVVRASTSRKSPRRWRSC